TQQDIRRFIGSVGANWRPQGWLGVRAHAGIDYINRKDTQLCRFSECPVSGTDHLGFKVDNRTNFLIYTLDLAATATRSFTPEIEGKTVVGLQYYQSAFDRNGASGRELPPGATT